MILSQSFESFRFNPTPILLPCWGFFGMSSSHLLSKCWGVSSLCLQNLHYASYTRLRSIECFRSRKFPVRKSTETCAGSPVFEEFFGPSLSFFFSPESASSGCNHSWVFLKEITSETSKRFWSPSPPVDIRITVAMCELSDEFGCMMGCFSTSQTCND